MKYKELKKEILTKLKTPGWQSPEEVDKYFAESLDRVKICVIEEISRGEGWEDSEIYYKNKIVG